MEILSTYVISDIHGNYNAYMEMLNKIHFSEDDMLYVLGDILDRGQNPIKVIIDLMNRENVVCLAGNHEYMAMECLGFLTKEITEESLKELNLDNIQKLLNWQQSGAITTLNEFYKLNQGTRKSIMQFISEFDLYAELHINGKVYVLVHAGIRNFKEQKPMWEYEIEELIWEGLNYEEQYYRDKYVITGQTPTMTIKGNTRPGYIYKNKHNIAIDCGAGFGVRLACLCLETEEEFYVKC